MFIIAYCWKLLWFSCRDNQEYLFVGDVGIRTGDTFRFYHSDSTTALSTITTITNQFSSLKQASTSNGDKREVFGGLIFTCCGRGESFFGQSDVDSSPFLANFTGVTFAGTFCGGEIGRGDLTSYVKESHEQKSIRCCLHVYSAVYLVMSYTPPKGNQRQCWRLFLLEGMTSVLAYVCFEGISSINI